MARTGRPPVALLKVVKAVADLETEFGRYPVSPEILSSIVGDDMGPMRRSYSSALSRAVSKGWVVRPFSYTYYVTDEGRSFLQLHADKDAA